MTNHYLNSTFRIQSASLNVDNRPVIEVSTRAPAEATALDYALLEDLIDRKVAVFLQTGIPVELTIALVHPALDPAQVSRNLDNHLITRNELIPWGMHHHYQQPPLPSANTQPTASSNCAPGFVAPTAANVDPPDTKHRVQLRWEELLAIKPDFDQEKLRRIFDTHYAREPFAVKRMFHVTKAEINVINEIREAEGEKLIRRQRTRKQKRLIR